LIRIKIVLPTKAQTDLMADLLVFRCPYTGMNVQTDLPKQEIKEGEQLYGRALGHDK